MKYVDVAASVPAVGEMVYVVHEGAVRRGRVQSFVVNQTMQGGEVKQEVKVEVRWIDAFGERFTMWRKQEHVYSCSVFACTAAFATPEPEL
ncbi:MAG: hypothetical protein ACOVPA_14540 [Rubrivivax sp.]